jgi:hypothetical protein
MNTSHVASVDELKAAFEAELATNKRAAAETAYALAFRYRNEDIDGARHFDIAGEWARKSIELFDELPSDTIEQVASTRRAVGGIELPDLLHSGVVRARLADVL